MKTTSNARDGRGRADLAELARFQTLGRFACKMALVQSACPRHDSFLDNPAHVWPVTARGPHLFNQRLYDYWRRESYSNSPPLGQYVGVGFEMVGNTENETEGWKDHAGVHGSKLPRQQSRGKRCSVGRP